MKKTSNQKRTMAISIMAGTSFTALSCLYSWSPKCPDTWTNCPDGTGHFSKCMSNDQEPKVTTSGDGRGAGGRENALPVGYICSYVCQYQQGDEGWSFCGSMTNYNNDGKVLDPSSASCPKNGSGSDGGGTGT